MHVVDQFILFSIGQVVAWLVVLYVDNSARRLLGHAFVATVGAFVGGYLSLWLGAETNKYAMIIAAFLGAGFLLHVVRYRNWRHLLEHKKPTQKTDGH
jgi:uncharacterized membrane protein YeaQ/YmgE (transglycosylase-associated protein family)